MRSRHALFFVALAASACGGSPLGDTAPPTPREASGSPRASDVWLFATHNSYWVDRGTPGDLFASGTQERISDQLLFDHVRGVEIDIHKSESAHAFRVYHTTPGNSLCDSLSECLGLMRAFHYAVPEHDPVEIVIELKELYDPNFDAAHSIADLDSIFETELGDLLYRPRDFMVPCDGHGVSTLADCAKDAEWPSIADLRGKFIVGVMGNWDELGATTTSDWVAYATSADIHTRAAFPMASSWRLDWSTLPIDSQLLVTQDELDAAYAQSILLQLEDRKDPLAAPFLARHGIARIDNAFTMKAEKAAVALGMQLLQTDTPWSQYDDHGPERPLRALPGSPPAGDLEEPGHRLRLEPGGETAWVFAYRTEPAASTTSWETTVSSGSDATRVGCLRAASADSTSKVTLCRRKVSARETPANGGGEGTADAERTFLDLETCDAGECSTRHFQSNEPSNGGPGDIVAFTVTSQSTGPSCVVARSARLVDWSSAPAGSLAPAWTTLANACVKSSLPRQGLARPPAPSSSGPTYFFAAKRGANYLTGEELPVVELVPTAGGKTTLAPQYLVDTSTP